MILYLLLCVLFLIPLSISDLHTHTISPIPPVLFGIGMALIHLIRADLTMQEFLLGLIPGIFLLILSLVSRSSIGNGDALTALACGSALGFSYVFPALTLALILCFIYCIVMIILKKLRRSDELAFLPFLSLSHLILLITEIVM